MSAQPWISSFYQRARIPYVFVGFLLLSLFIHLVTFYLFRVEYPPSVTITPPPARVVMLQPTLPEDREFLQWIDASDPAILGMSPLANPPLGDVFAFQPSYATHATKPIFSKLFYNRHRMVFPPAIDGLKLSERLGKPDQSAKAPLAIPKIPPTKIFYDSVIQKRFAGEFPEPKFTRTKANSLLPATFLVGTPSIGAEPLVFLQTSSGDKALDQDAENYLHRLPFLPGKLEWGFVTFYWGHEIFAKPQSSEDPS